MNRLEKQDLIANLNVIFKETSLVVVTHYRGLTVADLDSLRKEAFQVGAKFKIVKNSLTSIALKDTHNEVLSDLLGGPVAIAWSEDPVSCAKLLSDFAKKNQKLAIIGGSYNGSKLSVNDINVLASLPSMDEIRSKLVGLLTAAATKLVVLSRTPATNVVGVLKAYSEK